MARINYVKHAQQHYATKPVLDEDGKPKIIDTGRTTRRTGRPITRRVTVPDKTRPLDPETCESCREPILPGDAYRWVEIKTGPYSSHRRTKHARCGSWQPWDLSDALWARVAQIQAAYADAIGSAESAEDVQSALEAAATEIGDLADEKAENAQNMVQGSPAEELADQAEQLRSWADDLASATIPDFPEPEETDCADCGGTGKDPEAETEDEAGDCAACDGTGSVTPEKPTEDQLDDWRSECEELLADSPV